VSRVGTVERKTKETSVSVTVDLDGSGRVSVTTGIAFFDHMLDQLGRHASLDLTIKTTGDLHIDEHHTIEDTSLALGEAINEALGNRAGINRFGDATVPLDEALALAVIDFSGRPHLSYSCPPMPPMIGSYDTTLTKHIFASLANASKATIHIKVLDGENAHHMVEAQFKAFARALKRAVARTGLADVPSTKGVL
jgi:imidazoleglycerol-phosphate dehydratase